MIDDAVRRIHGGELVFPPALSGGLPAAIQGLQHPPGERLTLLLADDSVVRREGLARVLAECGFDVRAGVTSARRPPRSRPSAWTWRS